jgi:WD40 repeat protein
VSAVVFSPSSADTLYSGGWDHSVRVWDIENHVNVVTKVCPIENAIEAVVLLRLLRKWY